MRRYDRMGRALIAYGPGNEQGFAFGTHDHK
ncbi:hypothetical protein ACFXG5_34750 [Streptomyces goshikiensis]